MNKKNIKILGLLSLIIVGVVAIVVGRSLASSDTSILRNQVVDGLSFENAKLECNEICTFEVDIYNENKETYNLKSIDLKFKQSDDSVITLTGYVGESLESDEGRKITASIDKDITSSVDLEYIINK